MIVTGLNSLLLALATGFAFGWLLQRGKVTSCDVLTNQFRLRDFTVLKVMLTAIVTGGIGVLLLVHLGNAKYYVKDANILGVALGAVLFGAGMVIYGYCPGTGLAAIATGSVHALVGALGMLAGAIVYALTFDWVRIHVLSVWALGKVRLPQLTGIPDILWFAALALGALLFFYWIERKWTCSANG
jgi:uncharacterized membrane protein YedE/YeeE